MILGFSTQINGKPTHFVEKILRCFLNEYAGKVKCIGDFIYDSGETLGYQNAEDIIHIIDHKVKPKLHTIREDKNDRWQPETKIDFFINVRKKDMFRFAPTIPVVSVQEIEIIHVEFMNDIIISIDGKRLDILEKQKLAWNDGFENLYEFISYFKEDFKGKLIHWTDLKY